MNPEPYPTARLLHGFDRDSRLLSPVLASTFGVAGLDTLIHQARQEYAALLTRLPDLGGKQPFSRFMVGTAQVLAVYRIARQYGQTLEQAGRLIFEIYRAYTQGQPALIRHLLGRVSFSALALARLRHEAQESHRRLYPGGYVFNFIEGDGRTFDYGVDYLECGSCKFLAGQGAPELAPYICPADYFYSESLGWGLIRTQTLAEGAPRCDFRFKKGGPTRVAVPPALQEVIAKA